MQPAVSHAPSYPLAPEWRASDFILAVTGGLLGAFVGAAIAFDAAPVTLLIVSLALQNAGHLIAIWFVTRRRGSSLTRMGLVVEPSDGVFLFLGAGLQIGLSLLIVPLAERLNFEGSAQEITDSISPNASATAQIVLVLLVGLLAPITEELMFRGVLYQLLEQRRGFRNAVFGSARDHHAPSTLHRWCGAGQHITAPWPPRAGCLHPCRVQPRGDSRRALHP
jgi:membrane protease YdiL (CAAX protease family)